MRISDIIKNKALKTLFSTLAKCAMEHFLQFVVFKIRIYLEADDLTILSCMHKGHFSSARKQFYLKSEKIQVFRCV